MAVEDGVWGRVNQFLKFCFKIKVIRERHNIYKVAIGCKFRDVVATYSRLSAEQSGKKIIERYIFINLKNHQSFVYQLEQIPVLTLG